MAWCSLAELRADCFGARPVDMSAERLTVRYLRMKALEPYIAPLVFDVPPPTAPRSMLDQLAAKQLKSRTERKDKSDVKKHDKLMQRQAEVDALREGDRMRDTRDEYSAYDYSRSTSDYDVDDEICPVTDKIRKINLKAEKELAEKGPKKAAKIEKKRREEIAKANKERLKGVRKDEEKLREDLSKIIDKGEKKVAKLEYILIESLYV